jgi:NADPH:quinone reductase-like Zn-dependent oxidoreductase
LGGTTAVGTVTAVPAGETSLKVNDLVLVTDANTWADEVIVSKQDVAKISNLTAEAAATLPAVISAIGIFNLLPGLKAGDIVLQTEGETTLGQAIAQYGKSLGVNVIATTTAELSDLQYAAGLKSKGRVAHAITGSAGKANTLLLKLIPHSGVLVAHNGIYQPIGKTVGIDVPISREIFQDVKILGFDYFGFKRHDAAAFHTALSRAIELVSTNQVALTGNVHAVKDYINAVSDVEKTGKYNLLKF